MKEIWKVIDNSRSKNKEKMKAIGLLIQLYMYKTNLLGGYTTVEWIREHTQENLFKEQNIIKREKNLSDYLKDNNIDPDQICIPKTVF